MWAVYENVRFCDTTSRADDGHVRGPIPVSELNTRINVPPVHAKES